MNMQSFKPPFIHGSFVKFNGCKINCETVNPKTIHKKTPTNALNGLVRIQTLNFCNRLFNIITRRSLKFCEKN